MKKYFLIALCLMLIASLQNIKAQSQRKSSDTLINYYNSLVKSSKESDKNLLESKLYQLLKSNNENDWLTARRFFYQIKKVNTADSIAKADKLKFPLGQLVRNEKVDSVYKEVNPVKKEKLYNAWIKKFPPEKFGDDRIVYDYARNSLSHAYAEADNVEKAIKYANMVETPVWKGEGWAGTAQTLLQKGHIKEAEELFKKARANALKYMTTNRNDPGAGFAAIGFPGYSTSLANICVKQNKYNEALSYIRDAHDSSKKVNGYLNSMYAQILLKLGKEQDAFNVIDEAVKAGQATKEMKDSLKSIYIKVKGSDAGFENYLATINKLLVEKIRKDITKQIINIPASNFSLKDVDGNNVSLADYKGKTVILDFWATWCGPCKKSFPAMKMAVERYKSDPNVQFLFIHTWEREEHATDSAKNYIVKNNYPFKVLMDLKNKEGINPVVESYKVQGIPTKFVIDKNGNIRFRFTGFEDGDDIAVEELSAMIELAKS